MENIFKGNEAINQITGTLGGGEGGVQKQC